MHRQPIFRSFFLCFLIFIAFRPTTFAASSIQERADRFLALANAGYQALFRVNSDAQWNAMTDVTPEHDAAAEATGKAYAAFNGNPAIINEARELLTHQKELSELTVRQLKLRISLVELQSVAGLAMPFEANRLVVCSRCVLFMTVRAR